MKIKYYIFTASFFLIGALPVHAQFYLDGLNSYNNGGTIAYYQSSGMVTASGSYTAIAGALTLHGGNTLQIDGTYTASGNAVDSFSGDGSSVWPPVAAAKTIAGSAAPAFDIAKFMNGAGQTMNITNTQGINIAQRLDFANGITTTVRSNTSTGAVHFADNATYTNTALNDAQHVNGYVSKIGNDAFTFPVGSGTDLRTLSISAPSVATEEYSVAWIVGNPSVNGDPSNANALHPTTSFTAPIASVSTTGQWDWIPVTGSGAGLTITVAIPDLSGTGVLPADLRLVGWNGSSWVNLTATGNASGNTEGATLSGTMISGITAVGIGSVSTVLPVTFTSFTVQQDHCQGAITWATAYEHNNAYFTVERSSDGRGFQEIARVMSQGNSSETRQYAYTDVQPLTGWNYYRLVQVDKDGQHSVTNVKGLNFSCNNSAVKVYPNPFQEGFTIGINGYNDEVLHVIITDVQGKITGQANGLLKKVNGELESIGRQLSPGIYFMSIDSEPAQWRAVMKLIKQ